MTIQPAIFSDSFIEMCTGGLSPTFDPTDTTPGLLKGALVTDVMDPEYDQTFPKYGTAPLRAVDGEVANGNGYTTGGKNLTIVSFGLVSGFENKVGWKFASVEWPDSTITVRGMLLYIPSLSARAFLTDDYLQDYPTEDGLFSVTFNSQGLWRQPLRAVA